MNSSREDANKANKKNIVSPSLPASRIPNEILSPFSEAAFDALAIVRFENEGGLIPNEMNYENQN